MNIRLEAANLLRAIRAVGMVRAGDLLDWAFMLIPDSLAVQRLHAQALLHSGDFTSAESAIARALLQRPGSASLAQLRAECLAARGRWAQADAEVAAVMQRRPHHNRARELAARIAIERGQFARAISLLEFVSPNDRIRALRIRALLGDARGTGTAITDGIASTERARALLEAMHDPPATLAAAVFAAQGRLLDAANVLEEAVERNGGNQDETHCMLLEVLEQVGDAARLRRAMNRVTHAHPKARLLVGAILLTQGRFRAAVIIAAEMARTAHRCEALPTLIVAAAMLGRSRLARRALTRLRRTGRGIDARLMAQRWQRGMLGKMLRAQHDARLAGSDPGSSVLQVLLENARRSSEGALTKSRRIEDSAGGVAHLSERKNVLVSSPVAC